MKTLITLLTVLSFFSMSTETTLGKRKINFTINGHWEHPHKSPYLIPIDASIGDANYIIVEFLRESEETVTFQIKDSQGNIIYCDTVIPNMQIPYRIDLNGYTFGQYELIYLDGHAELSGEFYIE
ncbi:DUF3244 domain-containing protein [Bacteroides sp. GD17]|jgi:hypothetical protein|uniref:DUF3244 domain-containing protein n=1 Tax=Bacteroides sp. GD17 TaxID=3139826 RepID=UPI0025F12E9E|nr:DUF3244 domain-containing protein [uncultured Bacteroides sp.]